MKKCAACGEEFEDQFSFCPIDGTPFIEIPAVLLHQYNLTLISDAGLAHRLAIEMKFVVDQVKRAWPSFKSNPIAFSKTQLIKLKIVLKRTLRRPHLVTASLAATFVVCSIIMSVLLLEKHSVKPVITTDADEISPTIMIDLKDTNERSDGIGRGENGRVGLQNGTGEGSRPMPARAQGGGGGGNHDLNSASQGQVPQPSEIPAPISTTLARLPPQALAAAGIDIDPVLWRNLPFPSYGDPRSKSTVPSNGPGDGGGVGTNNGPGIGEGSGPGFGPGEKGNIGGDSKKPGGGGKSGAPGDKPSGDIERIYRSPEVTTRARVISKPEPQYTEEARRNQITGTVVLSVIFSRSGQVTNIRAMQTLCCGLTEKAIAAARLIQFMTATRNGQPVSVYMQLEYNFNLY